MAGEIARQHAGRPPTHDTEHLCDPDLVATVGTADAGKVGSHSPTAGSPHVDPGHMNCIARSFERLASSIRLESADAQQRFARRTDQTALNARPKATTYAGLGRSVGVEGPEHLRAADAAQGIATEADEAGAKSRRCSQTPRR